MVEMVFNNVTKNESDLIYNAKSQSFTSFLVCLIPASITKFIGSLLIGAIFADVSTGRQRHKSFHCLVMSSLRTKYA